MASERISRGTGGGLLEVKFFQVFLTRAVLGVVAGVALDGFVFFFSCEKFNGLRAGQEEQGFYLTL